MNHPDTGHQTPDTSNKRRLPAAVYWFGATSFTNDLASEMVYPLLPAFVTRTLGGGALSLGLLDGLAEAVAAAFKAASGYAAERPARRGPLVVIGYGIAALVRPLLALAGAAWHLVSLRAVDRLGKGLRTPPRDVMIADVVPAEHRGRAFGVHRAADHAGAMLGPLVAAGLLALGVTVRGVFWFAVIPGVAAAVLAWVAVRQAGKRASGQTDKPPETSVIGHPSSVIVVLAFGAMTRMPETLLLLRAQDLGVAVAAIPLLWAALHVVRSAASVPGGVLADRWGPKPTILLGWSTYAVLAFGFARAGSSAAAWLLFLAFGLVAALTESSERKMVAALRPAATRGRGFGWYHALVGIAVLPGATLFGFLYQERGAATSFLASAVATLIAAAALLAAGRNLQAGNAHG